MTGSRGPRPPPSPPQSRRTEPRLKVATKRITSGLPVQSFQALMAHLATLPMLRVKPRPEMSAEFDMTATSTPLQAEAFRLLGIRLP